jgi:putative transcriptional regulator
MSKCDLFSGLTTSLNEAKSQSEGKLTLKTHKMVIVDELAITDQG